MSTGPIISWEKSNSIAANVISTMLPKDVPSAKAYSPQARISIKFEPFANMVETNLTVL